MEYTDYWVARGSRAEVERWLSATGAAFISSSDSGFVSFVARAGEAELVKSRDWLLRVYDAESSAWGFEVFASGRRVGAAEYGDNAEWGIDEADNGFRGDRADTARVLGVSEADLDACLVPGGVERFCARVGFGHDYMLYPHDELFESAPAPAAVADAGPALYVYVRYSHAIGWFALIARAESARAISDRAVAAFSPARLAELERGRAYDKTPESHRAAPVRYSERYRVFWSHPPASDLPIEIPVELLLPHQRDLAEVAEPEVRPDKRLPRKRERIEGLATQVTRRKGGGKKSVR